MTIIESEHDKELAIKILEAIKEKSHLLFDDDGHTYDVVEVDDINDAIKRIKSERKVKNTIDNVK